MNSTEIKKLNKTKLEKENNGKWSFIRAHSDGEIVSGMGCTGTLVRNDIFGSAFRRFNG